MVYVSVSLKASLCELDSCAENLLIVSTQAKGNQDVPDSTAHV